LPAVALVGQSCWLLLLDFIKAFDRVPRELLWPLMAKLGVPPTLISVLQALHATVNVKFSATSSSMMPRRCPAALPKWQVVGTP
jgi:hypothetical protein